MCGGGAWCAHGKKNVVVKECGGGALCQGPKCETTASRRYKGYCVRYFIHLFPDEKNARNYKTKESSVVAHLKEKFPGVTWVCDKPVIDGCSRRRPDLFLDMGSHVLIVEIDEDQHKTYDCTCENRRLMEISKDVSRGPVVMVRFNPDRYVCAEKDKKIPSPWAYNKLGVCTIKKKWQAEWDSRLEAWPETVEYWMNNRSDKTIEVVKSYY